MVVQDSHKHLRHQLNSHFLRDHQKHRNHDRTDQKSTRVQTSRRLQERAKEMAKLPDESLGIHKAGVVVSTDPERVVVVRCKVSVMQVEDEEEEADEEGEVPVGSAVQEQTAKIGRQRVR
jgi:hypothetical protein